MLMGLGQDLSDRSLQPNCFQSSSEADPIDIDPCQEER